MLHTIFLVLGGLFCGVLSNLFGIGGGVFLVPLLLATGKSLAMVAGTSNVAVFGAACLNILFDYKKISNVRYKEILIMSGFSLLTANAGVLLSHGLPEKVSLSLFVCVLILSFFFIGAKEKNVAHEYSEFPSSLHAKQLIIYALLGSTVGLLSGLFGVGGGIFLVPLFLRVFKVSIKDAARLSLFVVLFATLFSSALHVAHGNVAWTHAAILFSGSILGAPIGKHLTTKYPSVVIKVWFRIFVLLICGWIVFKIFFGS